jgi:hypothetical protein
LKCKKKRIEGTHMGLDDMKNSEWIPWNDLSHRWRMKEFELLTCLQKGLQPYSENCYPFDCPRAHHTYRRLSDEHSRLVAPLGRDQIQYNKNEILPSDPEKEYEVSPEEEKILEEMKMVEEADSTLSSWKYFELPEFEGDFEEVLRDLRKTLFKHKDVQEFEQSHGIQPRDAATGVKRMTIGKRLRPSQWSRIQARQIAAKLWKEDPSITIAGMIQHSEIAAVTKRQDGSYYVEKTVHVWIKEFCPNRSPGRRPERKKDGVSSTH